ncbi:Dabb family protein [Novosphingobium terrae]|uniref:Dabb family protein n=1 Tax=Novosphingobium terrae TaxID=2726189 RepID=UPI001981D258|nr:Dabb family protein [Novosphingobium terrae]
MLHHAFFWLNNPASREDRDALIRGLETLRAIPLIRTLTIGVPALTEQRDVVESGFAVSELMVFDSLADQNAYQSHPLHQRFVEECSHLWSKVVVYDVEALP